MATESKGAFGNPLREIIRPFIDLVHAPRALWGINLGYFLEGLVYFGILGYLSLYFSDFVFRGVPNADEWAGYMVTVLTAGITISMFALGFVADRVGVRRALIFAFVLLVAGRLLLSAAPTVLGLEPAGVGSALHLVTMAGIVIIVIGYGMYEPACYAGVRQFTNPRTAPMAYAMLYALMNLGGWLPTFAFLLRDDDFLGIGISGTFWVYTALTAVALATTWALLSRKTVEAATAKAAAETESIQAEECESPAEESKDEAHSPATGATLSNASAVPLHLWLAFAATAGLVLWKLWEPFGWVSAALVMCIPVVISILPGGAGRAVREWTAVHPLSNAHFFFFIFALIPVQTLFTYTWLVLPPYLNRAYDGWIGEYFEIAVNANPLLIFVMVPIIAALTTQVPVYRMMIIGTTIMAAPAILLAFGPNPWALFAYIFIMTVGESAWQPRFLQYAAEIAPEGRTGQYVGVARLPWFLTKVLVPLLYSGWMMNRYCPKDGPKDTETMWLIFFLIAITTPIMLVLARRWMGTKLEEQTV